MRPVRCAVLCLASAFFFPSIALSGAQSSREASPAPIPAQILAAKKVFIGNAGGEDSSSFSGGRDRAYNEFYAAMKSWGRYELVGSPAEADVLFEIQFVVGPYERPVVKGDSIGAQTADPQIRLVIRDPKTQTVLWGLLEHVPWAILQNNRDKNFESTLSRLVDSVQKLAALPASAISSAK
jgi:hypothetical protein